MWWWVAAWVVSAIVSIALAPKPENAHPAGLDQFNVPTAEVGREIPVLFGTRIIKASNTVWYGDLVTKAIRKKGGKK